MWYNVDMATLEEYREERLKKLAEIRARGIEPYPSKSFRDTEIREVIENFTEKQGSIVTVAGRIVAIRSFGKLAFVKIRDESGEVQIFMKSENEVPSGRLGVSDIKLLDLGDFVEASGTVDKSQTGEISVFANSVRLLVKSLRPLPGRDGFTNKEERAPKICGYECESGGEGEAHQALEVLAGDERVYD